MQTHIIIKKIFENRVYYILKKDFVKKHLSMLMINFDILLHSKITKKKSY